MCTRCFAAWQCGTGSLAPTLAVLALAGALLSLADGPSAVRADCVDYADYMHWVASAPLTDDFLSSFDFGGSCIVGDYLYLTAEQYGAKVFDIADRARPRLIAELPNGGYPYDIEVRGDYAYVTGTEFYVVDVSTPESPQVVGTLESWNSRCLALVGDYALVTQWGLGDQGVEVIDISDPSHPVQVGSVDTGESWGICVVGEIACVAAGDLKLVDVSDPVHPHIVGVLETLSDALSVTAAGSLALVYEEPNSGGGTLHVVDISAPQSPQLLSSLDYGGWARGLAIMGDLAFITMDGLLALDLSDPSHPAPLGRAFAGHAIAVALAAPYAYVTDGNNRVHVIDISNPAGAPMVGHVTTVDHPFGVSVDEDLAFVAEARFATPQSGLLEIFNVADPTAPQLVGAVATPGWATDVAVSSDYAYVLDSYSYNAGEGLQIIDISDPTQPTIVNHLPLSTSYSLVLVGDLAFIANYSVGLTIVDLSDPLNPWVVSQTPLAGWPKDVAVVGDVAYVAMTEVGFQTVDISDPVHPQILGTATGEDGGALGEACCITVLGDIAYITDIDSRLLAFDVSDPGQPRLLATLPVSLRKIGSSIGWDLLAADGSLYLASNGLQVEDITSSHVCPYQLRAVGGWWAGVASRLALTPDHVFMTCEYDWQTGSLCILPRQCGPQPVGIADSSVPAAAALAVYPNPFNPSTTLSFAVPSTGRTTLAIYDAQGREVVTLVDEKLEAGLHRRDWTGNDAGGRRLPSGVYLCRLTTPGGAGAEKLVMLQ